jgi:hypothetical protein
MSWSVVECRISTVNVDLIVLTGVLPTRGHVRLSGSVVDVPGLFREDGYALLSQMPFDEVMRTVTLVSRLLTDFDRVPLDSSIGVLY